MLLKLFTVISLKSDEVFSPKIDSNCLKFFTSKYLALDENTCFTLILNIISQCLKFFTSKYLALDEKKLFYIDKQTFICCDMLLSSSIRCDRPTVISFYTCIHVLSYVSLSTYKICYLSIN